MRFYFDEAGNFQLPADRHPVGVVAGVVVADHAHDALEADFAAFVKTLRSDELQNGEPKGSKLDTNSRARLLNLLSRHDGFMFAHATMELDRLREWPATNPALVVSQSLEVVASKLVYESAREQMHAVARAVGNMHHQQLLRLVTWYGCIRSALQYSLSWMADREFAASWWTMRMCIDPVQDPPGTEALAFATLLPGWAATNNEHHPILLQPEIHTETHPFIRTFTVRGEFVYSKMFGDVTYPDSRSCWGIQLADICAQIVFRASKDLHNQQALVLFGALMQLSGHSVIDGAGLVTPVPEHTRPPMSERYEILTRKAPQLGRPALRFARRQAT